MSQRQGKITDEYDRPVSGATVFVFNTEGGTATLTSDGSAPLAQPVTTDEFGVYTYHANSAVYREDIHYGGKLRAREVVAVGLDGLYPLDRAGKYFAFDAGGNPIASVAAGGADATLRTDLAAASGVALVGGAARPVATRAAMAALNGSVHPVALLYEAGREWRFVWNAANLSAQVTADPSQETYVAPSSDTTGASGAWVRKGLVESKRFAGTDADPLLVGKTINDLATAESASYTGARYLVTSGPDIFIRRDLPDGALDAERYGIGSAQTAAENGARLTWLIARGYRKIVHRAARLEASGIEIYDRDDTTLAFRNLHNPSTTGAHTFHLNKNAPGATDAITRLRIEADLISNVLGAGHVFNIEGLLADSPAFLAGCNEIHNLSLNAGIFYFNPSATQPGRSTNVIYTGVWRTPQDATVPIMFQDNAASSFNNNIVSPRQMFCPDAVPAIRLLNRSTSAYNNGNIFSLPLEYCIAGALHLTGQAAPQIRDLVQYDQTFYGTAYVGDMVYIGRYADYAARYPGYAALSYTGSPLGCHGASVTGYKRDWTMTLGEWFDINIAYADKFYIDGVIATSDDASRTIAISLPSVALQGVIGANCKNIARTNFSPVNHIDLSGQIGRFPNLEVNGIPANALGYASGDVSSAAGTLTNGNNITSVTKGTAGIYDVVMATALAGTNYQVLVMLKEADGTFWITKTSGSAFTVSTRSVGSTPAPADKAFSFVVMAPS